MEKVRLDKNNFWKPFIVFVLIFGVIYFFGSTIVSYLSIKTTTENTGPLSSFFLLYFHVLLITIIYMIIIASIPTLFIIRRLLSENPKKVFYFELPILIIIYSIFGSANILIGMVFGGPDDITILNIINLVLYPIIFKIIWLCLLTGLLYIYYKHRILNKNL